MSLILSSANMIAADGGNVISIAETNTNFVNTSQSLTFALSDSTSNFSMNNNGQLKYSGLLALPCVISASYSYSDLTGGLVGGIALYKNGSQIASSIRYDSRCPEITNYSLTLNPNDYLEIWANSNQLQLPCYIIQCQLSIFGTSII